jgi:tRNA A37 threonylcarbamoyladenosine biosynthesis protein TsaE
MVILEWPEKVKELLPKRKIEFVFEVEKKEGRVVTMKETL